MKKIMKTVVLALMMFAFTLPAFAEDAKKKPLGVGDMMPDFVLPSGESYNQRSVEKVSFEKDIKPECKKILMFAIMTTSCTACKAELSLISDLANKYGDDIIGYAINVDIYGAKYIPAYDKRFGFNLKYLRDPDFMVAQWFGFTYTPALIITDCTGKVIYLKGGYTPNAAAEIIKVVKDALGKR